MVARVWFSCSILSAFLGLDRLVQAVGPAPARHHAAGELVDDDDLRLEHTRPWSSTVSRSLTT